MIKKESFELEIKREQIQVVNNTNKTVEVEVAANTTINATVTVDPKFVDDPIVLDEGDIEKYARQKREEKSSEYEVKLKEDRPIFEAKVSKITQTGGLSLGFSEPVIVFGKGKMPGAEVMIVQLNSEGQGEFGRRMLSEGDGSNGDENF